MGRHGVLWDVTLILTIILFVVSVSCGLSKPLQFVTYDEADGFPIDYPAGWHIEKPEDLEVKVVLKSTESGPNLAYIRVAKCNVPAYSSQDFAQSQISAIPDTIEGYAPISTEQLTIDDVLSIKHTYSEIIDQVSYVSMLNSRQIWIHR